MSRAWGLGSATSAALIALATAAPLAAQTATLVGELSRDSLRLADVFELRVDVDVPPGTIVYFPDTLPASAELESFAPVAWREASADDGGATLTLTYRLIPFGVGRVPVPEFDAVLAPVGPDGPPAGAVVTEIAGGSFVGTWEDGQRRYGSGARRVTVSSPNVRVMSVQAASELGAGVQPRGPDDVMGLGWSWPNLLLFVLFSSVIVGAAVTAAQDWARHRRHLAAAAPEAITAEGARREALEELDRLLRAGPYSSERERELYASSSAVVRRYAAHLDPEWGPALTSSELMRAFAQERYRHAASDRAVVETEMEKAERVKFGRPPHWGPEVANAHLTALRASLAPDATGARGDDA